LVIESSIIILILISIQTSFSICPSKQKRYYIFNTYIIKQSKVLLLLKYIICLCICRNAVNFNILQIRFSLFLEVMRAWAKIIMFE